MIYVEGLAADVWQRDGAGDRFHASAFGSLRQTVPFWLEHSASWRAGNVDAWNTDAGLSIFATLTECAPGFERVRRALERGVDGLSVGFVASEQIFFDELNGGRRLRDIIRANLLEISLVCHPMQLRARVSRWWKS